MKKILYLTLLATLLLTCKTQQPAPTTAGQTVAEPMTDGETTYQRFRPENVMRPDSFTMPNLRRDNYEDYLPDTLQPELLPERRLRLNFHVMNTTDTLYDMVGEKSVEYSTAVLNYTNQALRDNKINWLNPEGKGPPPVYPARIQWVLPEDPATGRPAVYDHFDDDLYGYVHTGSKRNRSDRAVLNKYNVREDEELNIYWMGPPREAIEKMGRKEETGSGIFLQTAIKVTDVLSAKVEPWAIRKVFEHELGHALGLWHAWGEDGCADTPRHGNKAWSMRERGPGLSSNNLMDYSPDQKALTPCQIGKMHMKIADVTTRQRGWVIRDWCDYRPHRPIEITRVVTLDGARDFASDLIVRAGGILTINNRVSLPEGAAIRVDAGGTLKLGPKAILHNDCGGTWRGIWLADGTGRNPPRVTAISTATILNVAP